MMWRILKYVQHLIHIRHRRGHGIHSPYCFDFVSGVLYNTLQLKVPDEIFSFHRELRKDHELGIFVRKSSVNVKYGALLFRIAQWFEPSVIIELGTGVGISTLYLGSGSRGTPLHTIERDEDRISFARQVISRQQLGSARIHAGEMEEKLVEVLPLIRGRFLAFVDGNHHYTPTIGYLEKLVEKAGDEAVIIMDDIYWSRGMHKAWSEVTSWPEVRISIDLFHMGIMLFKPGLSKAHLKIRF